MSNQEDYLSSSALSLIASSSKFVHQPAGTVANGSDPDSSYLWPSYFVERPDGTHTALIEVDQLPELIRIRGLPPKLSAADTAGMTSVGVKKGGQRKYIIDIADTSGKFHFGELSKHTARENASVTPTTTPSSKALSDAAVASHAESSPTIAEASTSNNTGPEQEVVIVKPTLRKGEKVYCTYWIARGECHYTQQGCRFKHEMPDLEILREIMGRRSFPKWWLESIGPQRSIAPRPSDRPAPTNRQQGKRRAINATPKPLTLTTPNTDINSSSATETRNVVAHAPAEGLSSIVSKSIPRKDGGEDIRSRMSGQSGSKMRSSNSDILSAITESVVIHDKKQVSDIRAPYSGPSGNSMIHTKQPVSNDGALISDPASDSMIHTTQPVGNDRSPLWGPGSNNLIETSQQPISNTNNLTTSTSRPRALPASPLRIKIPQKYMPQFRVAVLPTVSSSSSSTPIRKPRVNLPLTLRQSNVSSALGNTNGGKGNTETHGAEMEGGHDERDMAYNNGGSIETTRPYDDVFDLLGPF